MTALERGDRELCARQPSMSNRASTGSLSRASNSPTLMLANLGVTIGLLDKANARVSLCFYKKALKPQKSRGLPLPNFDMLGRRVF